MAFDVLVTDEAFADLDSLAKFISVEVFHIRQRARTPLSGEETER